MIYFIQPVIPKYRVSFFNELNKHHPLSVQYSKVDFLGVKSYESSNIEFNKIEAKEFLSLYNQLFWQKGIKLLDYNKDDVVVISGNPRVINHMLLMLICKIRNIPVIWWGQGWTASSHGFFSKMRLLLMTLADGVAVYTEDEAKKLKHIKNIIGLNNGLDVDSIRSLNEKSVNQNMRRNLDKTLNLLFIGRLTEKSNINFLINTIPLINRSIHLHVIGSGPLTSSIKKLISANNVSSNVTMHGAIYNESDISKIANICDFFIYPGSVGLSLIHAYAYGLPAIIHNCSYEHMPEFSAFINGYNGVSFILNDKYSLANAIDSIDYNSIDTLKKNAYDTVSNTYNTKDMAKRFSNLIRTVTN